MGIRQWGREKTCFQQLRTHHQAFMGRKTVRFGTEGTRTDLDKRLFRVSENADAMREKHNFQ